jgi:2',3'-cyclic-nucleotide 2'-phosphodiesterase/3'-nucleotidase/5'-nucleotidase
MKSVKAKFLCVLAMTFTAGCGKAGDTALKTDYAVGEELKVQILQTSDMHGRFINYDYATDRPTASGSFAAAATKIKELRKEIPLTFVIDTGDAFQDNGNELFSSNQNKNPMALMFNALRYDTFTLGNHEFDQGVDNLTNIIRALKQPEVLTGNVRDGEGNLIARPYVILNRGGLRLAVVGMTNPNLPRWSAAENLAEHGYTVTDPADEMPAVAADIKDNADLIVYAMHLPLEPEYTPTDNYSYLVPAFPHTNAALMGHAHAVINTEIDGVPALMPGSRASHLGRIVYTLKKTAEGFDIADVQHELVPLENVTDDAAMVRLTADAHKKALADARTVIGRLTGGPLVPPDEVKGIPQAQLEPTALIAFINEVQMFYTGADVASAALFRSDANLEPGNITRAGVSLIYMYDNTLRAYNMTGAQLKKYMEWSAAYFNTFKEGDLTVSFNPDIRGYNYDMFSGVQYDIDISQPAGSRIKNVRYPDGRPLGDSDKLVVAVNDYRGQGAISRELFPNGEVTLAVDLTTTLGDEARIRTLIGRYIVEEKDGVLTPEFDHTVTNFTLTGYSWDEKLRAKAVEQLNAGLISVPVSTDGRTPNVRAIRAEDLQRQP